MFNKGSSIIRVSSPLDNFKYGDEMNIKLEIDNSKSDLEINNIDCKLHRKVILYDKERNLISKQEDIIRTKKVDFRIDARDSWSKLFSISLTDKNSNNSISSCKGELIESSYYAKITAVPSGFCVSSDQPIDLELPIIITSIPNKNVLSLDGWNNAQESPREDLIVIDAYRYAEGDRLRFTMNND